MPKHKDEYEMAQLEAIKIVRTAIRLKYSILADRELNEIVPAIQDRVRGAIGRGEQWYIDPSQVFDDDDFEVSDIVVVMP